MFEKRWNFTLMFPYAPGMRYCNDTDPCLRVGLQRNAKIIPIHLTYDIKCAWWCLHYPLKKKYNEVFYYTPKKI